MNIKLLSLNQIERIFDHFLLISPHFWVWVNMVHGTWFGVNMVHIFGVYTWITSQHFEFNMGGYGSSPPNKNNLVMEVNDTWYMVHGPITSAEK